MLYLGMGLWQSVYTPGRYDLLFALLGVVLGPVLMGSCIKAIKDREGDFDRELGPAAFYGSVFGLLAGLAITAGAAWWLWQWIPEYVQW